MNNSNCIFEKKLNAIYMVLMFCFLFQIGDIDAQTTLSNQYFSQQTVEDKFELMSIIQSDVEVIFRKNQIEFYYKDATFKEQNSFFLLLNSRSNTSPVGILPHEERTVPIQNKAQAEVLGATTMQINTYQAIKYTDVYKDTDLEVSFKNGQLEFSMLNRQGQDIPLDLVFSNLSEMKTDGGNIKINKFNKEITLRSEKSYMQVTDKRKMNFVKKKVDSSKENYKFSIKIN